MRKWYIDRLKDYVVNPHFAHPPYRAEMFNEVTGWCGVLNGNGINCVSNSKGGVILDLYSAEYIAAQLNKERERGNQWQPLTI